MQLILSIGLGGAVGAIGRYLAMGVVSQVLGMGFPYATLFVNVLGSFLLGILIEGLAIAWQVDAVWRAFLVVGVLGGFTTFSTFSLDAVYLIERGELWLALLYALLSVSLAVLALGAGMFLMRHLVG